jgi:caa(3)-type oxidase subunit IV
MSEHSSAEPNIRRYLIIFGCMVVSALVTVGVALAPLGNHKLNIGLALVVVALQAFLVLGFMMHLLSERRLIHTVLIFTGIFILALMVLTVVSVREVPSKPHHAPEVVAQTKS